MARILRSWLDSYLDYTAQSESPTTFHLWTGVFTIAGVLRRQVWIDQRYFSWTPNFYILLVGPAGVVSKSTSADIGERLLRKVPGVKFGPASLTWQFLIEAMEQSKYSFEYASEKVISSPLSIVSSELGTLVEPQNRELIDNLVSLWDGKEGSFDRGTRQQGEVKVINPWINIIGCTTPEWLMEYVPRTMATGGFFSRCICVYGEAKRHLMAYPADHLPSTDAKRIEDLLVQELRHMSHFKGEMALSDEAKAWGIEWYEKHYQKMRDEGTGSTGGYMARKQTHLHKIAMVLSCSRRDTLEINLADLMDADKLLATTERDLEKVYQFMLADETTRARGDIAEALARGPLRKEALYRLCYSKLNLQTFQSTLDDMERAGVIERADPVPQFLNPTFRLTDAGSPVAVGAEVVPVGERMTSLRSRSQVRVLSESSQE